MDDHNVLQQTLYVKQKQSDNNRAEFNVLIVYYVQASISWKLERLYFFVNSNGMLCCHH